MRGGRIWQLISSLPDGLTRSRGTGATASPAGRNSASPWPGGRSRPRRWSCSMRRPRTWTRPRRRSAGTGDRAGRADVAGDRALALHGPGGGRYLSSTAGTPPNAGMHDERCGGRGVRGAGPDTVRAGGSVNGRPWRKVGRQADKNLSASDVRAGWQTYAVKCLASDCSLGLLAAYVDATRHAIIDRVTPLQVVELRTLSHLRSSPWAVRYCPGRIGDQRRSDTGVLLSGRRSSRRALLEHQYDRVVGVTNIHLWS